MMQIAFLLLLLTAPREYPAAVIAAHDGDTITVAVDLGWRITLTEPLRLHGVDCPELRTPEGIAARDFTRAWLAGRKGFVIEPRGSGRDKYGRLLALLRDAKGESLGDAIVASGHGRLVK